MSQIRAALFAAASVLLAVGILTGCASTTTPTSSLPTAPPGYAAPRTTQPAVVPVVPAGPAKAITAREWSLIAKSPTAHTGERVIVYGEVKQFDSATGSTGFRANVDGVEHELRYGYADYETNTVLAGSASDLSEIVQGDLFRAEVTVTGAYTYNTTMGGQMTAPQLTVTKIKVTGSTA